MAVAPATRRAHSHQPGLCSDKWGASCPDGGAVAGGPRPPSERWRSWSYEAGPAAVTASAWSVLPYMHLPAVAPAHPSPTKPSRQRPREGGNPPGGAASLPPRGRRAATPSTADEERRPPCPQVDADPALLEIMQRAPTGSNPPPSPICGRHPLGQPTQQGTQAAVNQRRIIQQPRQGCPHQETIAVLPPGQLQKPTKNTKQSYKGRLIIRHFCSPGRPSSPTTCCALSPTWPSR